MEMVDTADGLNILLIRSLGWQFSKICWGVQTRHRFIQADATGRDKSSQYPERPVRLSHLSINTGAEAGAAGQALDRELPETDGVEIKIYQASIHRNSLYRYTAAWIGNK